MNYSPVYVYQYVQQVSLSMHAYIGLIDHQMWVTYFQEDVNVDAIKDEVQAGEWNQYSFVSPVVVLMRADSSRNSVPDANGTSQNHGC